MDVMEVRVLVLVLFEGNSELRFLSMPVSAEPIALLGDPISYDIVNNEMDEAR